MHMKTLVRCSASLVTLILVSSPTYAYEKELATLAARLGDNISRAGKKTIAVVDFTDLDGNVHKLGRFVAEELSVALADSSKRFELVDRTHLKTLMKEHKLAESGLVDPATARKLGLVAGVDALITGTITPFGDSVKVAAKVLETATAKVVAAGSAEIPKTKGITDLLAGGPESTSEQAPPSTSLRFRQSPAKPFRVEEAGVRLELRRCRAYTETVVCEFTFTNLLDRTARSVRLTFRGDSLIDDRGNRSEAKAIWFGGTTDSRKQTVADMPSGVPLNVVEVFEGYTSGAETVTLVLDGGRVVMRSIPLDK